VNTILKEKWIKVQEGRRPKGPSNPKDYGRDKAHGRTFSDRQEKNGYLCFTSIKNQWLKVYPEATSFLAKTIL
jgi:hypothetical protein